MPPSQDGYVASKSMVNITVNTYICVCIQKLISTNIHKPMSDVLMQPIIPNLPKVTFMQNSDPKNNHILPHAIIVEDQKDLANAYSIALTQAGYFVKIISNGKEALKVLKSVSPRLLLLDLNLPEVSGDEILESIKDLPAYKHTRIFLISANTRMAQHLTDEVDLVLEKPIGIRVLKRLAARHSPNKKDQTLIDPPNDPPLTTDLCLAI